MSFNIRTVSSYRFRCGVWRPLRNQPDPCNTRASSQVAHAKAGRCDLAPAPLDRTSPDLGAGLLRVDRGGAAGSGAWCTSNGSSGTRPARLTSGRSELLATNLERVLACEEERDQICARRSPAVVRCHVAPQAKQSERSRPKHIEKWKTIAGREWRSALPLPRRNGIAGDASSKESRTAAYEEPRPLVAALREMTTTF
jgi:hypothetical protein